MSIITLTTDMGLRDFYLSTVKAALLKGCDNIQLVDITHQIPAFDLAEGAYQLRHAWPHFPPGTIHILSVDTLGARNIRSLAIREQDQFFLGPDNGLFSLVFDQIPDIVYQIEMNQNGSATDFPSRDVLVRGAIHLANGKDIQAIGRPIGDILQMTNLQPQVNENSIKGSVIHIDHFDNIIVNIRRDLLERVRKDRDIMVHIGRTEYIDKIESNYYDVVEGEKMCFFNSSEHLEIAINRGRASSLLGLKLGDIIQIDFK